MLASRFVPAQKNTRRVGALISKVNRIVGLRLKRPGHTQY
jgi:hypothetical protein